MRNIQVFLDFANLYWYFIQSVSKIARPLILMLKTSSAPRLSKNLLSLIDVAKVNEIGISGGNCKDKMIGKSLFKNLNRVTSYLTPDARQAFIQLRQAFTKARILQYFDLEYHIRIETDISSYAIGWILS